MCADAAAVSVSFGNAAEQRVEEAVAMRAAADRAIDATFADLAAACKASTALAVDIDIDTTPLSSGAMIPTLPPPLLLRVNKGTRQETQEDREVEHVHYAAPGDEAEHFEFVEDLTEDERKGIEFEEDEDDKKDEPNYDDEVDAENLDDFITNCLLKAVAAGPGMDMMEWEAEIETDPMWSPLSSPSAFEAANAEQQRKRSSLPGRVHEKVVGTVHLITKKIADKVQLSVNFVVRKWEATDQESTEAFHWTEEFFADKASVVSERASRHSGHVVRVVSHTASVQSERIQKGVHFVKAKSKELAESERMQHGIEFAREKSEPLQRGLVYAKEKADAAKEAANVVSGRVSAKAEVLAEKLQTIHQRNAAHAEACIGKVAVKAETVTAEGQRRASEGLQTGFGLAKEKSEQMNAKVQRSVDFVAGKAEEAAAKVAVSKTAHLLRETSSKLEAKLRSPAKSKSGGC